MPTWIVDAHPQYQDGLNVEQVAVEGYGALIVKATQGATGYTADKTLDDWITRARGKHMVPGAYHWLTNAPASNQLDHYLGRIASVGGPDGLLCAVDVEDTTSPPSLDVLTAFVHGFADRTGGHPLLLYTGAWWWLPRGWRGVSMAPYLWASRYVPGPGTGAQLYAQVPASWWTPGYGGWASATMLQFTDKALVAGQRVDASAYLGTVESLQTLTHGGTTMPGEIADFACSHVPDPATGADTGAHMALGAIWTAVNGLVARPDAPAITLSPADIATIREGLAADVVSLLAPQFKMLGQMADRLGAAGDALGTLNDPASS